MKKFMKIFVIMTVLMIGAVVVQAQRQTRFLLQTGTPLSESQIYDFMVAANSDLYVIQKKATGTDTTEVHILTAASKYQTFSQHIGTALHETGRNFNFALASNGDLFAVKKTRTGTGKTEVHVLSAASNYQKFILQTGTALEEAGSNFKFMLASNRDLFAIKTSGTGSGSIEVHVLSASSGYQEFSVHTKTPLQKDASYDFALAPNRDLFAIKKNKTGSSSTEVHVLSAASKYQTFILQTGTVLHETDSSFSFGVTSDRNLFVLKKRSTGTNSTEVHIIDLP